MQKDASYHEAAIKYNEELADFAQELSGRLENEEVSKWSRAVSKQHKWHAGRHKRALAKILNRGKGAVENTEDGGEDQALDVDGSKSVSEQQAEFAATQKEG